MVVVVVLLSALELASAGAVEREGRARVLVGERSSPASALFLPVFWGMAGGRSVWLFGCLSVCRVGLSCLCGPSLGSSIVSFSSFPPVLISLFGGQWCYRVPNVMSCSVAKPVYVSRSRDWEGYMRRREPNSPKRMGARRWRSRRMRTTEGEARTW